MYYISITTCAHILVSLCWLILHIKYLLRYPYNFLVKILTQIAMLVILATTQVLQIGP